MEELDSNKKIKWIVIDEIQKLPKLLDVVHSQIEKKRFLFALTGSSARKLKLGAANLLAGRALTYSLFPLTHTELKDQFHLDEFLKWGGLPQIYNMELGLRAHYLKSYSSTYLKEEIISEQLIRKVQPFRSFLSVAAQSAGKILNHSKIARDIDSDSTSVQTYFEILEDTFIGFHLPAYHTSVRKRVRKNPKFYFVDLGVQSALARTLDVPLTPQTYSYGDRFEQFLITEIYKLSHYKQNQWEFFYLRTKDDVEIDLIIDRPGQPLALIEIKSTTKITDDDISSLASLSKDFKGAETFCLSLDPIGKKINHVRCLHWQKGLEALGLQS